MTKKKKINKPYQFLKSNNIEDELLQFIALKPTHGTKLKHIIKWSMQNGNGENIFLALEKLLTIQKIKEVEQDVFIISQPIIKKNTVSGILDLTQSGNGYVIIDKDKEDIFIPANKLNRAFDGDKVLVRINNNKKRTKPEGEIIEILERKKDTFIGIVEMGSNYAFVSTDKKSISIDFYITPEEIKRTNIQKGDRVIVKIKDWPSGMKNPIGNILGKLGKQGEHESDMQAIIIESGINYIFPNQVEQELKAVTDSISDEEINLRRDFRNILTFTIDPYDAKDFDDALSIQYLENGNIEIGVHIADVSHFVKENTELDKESYSRATSVYLVDRVIPMLPEKLSNNICSLVPNKDRLTFSAVFQFNRDGKIEEQWFGKTIIHSAKRFTYEEVQEIIETQQGEFIKEINDLKYIAEILRKEKFKHGAIAFETDEVKFILDENKKPVDVYVKERKDAHLLIEDFMLLANKKVAELIGKKKNPVLPFVFRVHDRPDTERLEEFAATALRFGYKIKLDSPKNISSELNMLMQKIKGRPEQNILENMAIRSMAKAIYTTKNIGHYGLAFDYYTHFTSPIRRYPDLMVHRLLFEYLNDLSKNNNPSKLEENCQHCSAQERKAMDAERESIKYKQVEYMSSHIGEIFNGIISGIMHYGIFVELLENKCEGMIRIDTIRDELIYNEKQKNFMSLTGNRNFEMGDTIKIKVKKADLQMRQLDFIYVG